MNFSHNMLQLCIAASLALTVGGCSSLASKTNTLTDDKIKSQTSAALGLQPDELTIVSRRTEGTNTYVNLKASSGNEFTCMINGGNMLTLGMTNPPVCEKKREPLRGFPGI